METIEQILRILKRDKQARTRDLVKEIGISRQNIALHLKRLVEEGRLTKTGSTQSAVYHWSKNPSRAPSKKETGPALHLVKNLAHLEEHKVFGEIALRMRLKKILPKNVYEIASYSFSEMLNNAIDHSKSKKAFIDVSIEQGQFCFEIRDSGIGAFKNVKDRFKLGDEHEAAYHLFKGKQTTDPKRHSGEGIFFTSRIADTFILRSHRLQVKVDNLQDDLHYSDTRNIKGTAVSFRIKNNSKKNLQSLFMASADEDFTFSKNDVRIRLNAKAPLVSRSEARRLLVGMDKFKSLTFDFTGITGIGQAFADEIFRVFASFHPDIEIHFVNATSAVAFMIGRAKSTG